MDLKVAPQTVQLQTVTKLRDAILHGFFRPGEKLVEGELCRAMGVSRSSIREALRRLEAEKLITIVPNKGPSVTEITWAQAEDIYHTRALLEGEAAALAAKRATPADVAAMGEALQAFDQAVAEDDAAGRLTATARFYEAILQSCGNSLIGELLQGLLARINFLRARSMSQSGRSTFSASEMRRMLNAIEQRDEREARAAAVEHVEAACAAARAVFESTKVDREVA
jgi:DNA-binding GntR family transcriptional regulator